MDRTNENIKKYYSSKKMSEDKVELLLSSRSSRNYSGAYWKIAVAALLIVGLVFTFYQFQENGIEQRIVDEIAMNHKKELNIEFPANNLNDLEDELDKLDFKLTRAEPFISENYELMGGRYCSIQGNLAAQLKIKNKSTNGIETLYVTDLNPELSNVKSTSVDSDHVRIKIWKEDGLLYGIASSAQ